MVQKKVLAHSKTSSSKVSIERKIEDFTGNYSASDITPGELESDDTLLKKLKLLTKENATMEDDFFVAGQIETSTPPPTNIPTFYEDEVHKKIDKLIKGKQGKNS